MKGTRRTLLLSSMVLPGLLVAAAWAQPPVKYVDEQGNVTYSDKPVPGAVKSEAVPVLPAPDEKEVEAARRRIEKTGKMADEARRARESRERERAEARKAAEAKKSRVEVIEGSGGRGYYPEYYNPPLIKPGRPGERPPRPGSPPPRPGTPGSGRPDHPAYRPPGVGQPPVARPPVSIQPVPR